MEGAKHIKLMANVILTTNCQRKCAYCFAQEDRNANMSFTFDNFKRVVSFIATGPKLINLLGGEPTLNKDFVRMLEHVIINDFLTQVFTNGMIPDKVLNNILSLLNKTSLREDQLYFAININEEKYRTTEEIKLQDNFLKKLGNLVYPSFTIHDKDTDLLFLRDFIHDYNLDPVIRLGLAMPVKPGNNKYLPMEDYSKVAANIIKLSESSPGITIKFDCGFPLCMFTIEEIGELRKNEENDFVFVCGSAIDIYPDLTFTNCYPLSQVYRGNINDYRYIMEIYGFLMDGFIAPFGIYGEQCTNCSVFGTECAGGCKGFFELPKVEDIKYGKNYLD
jgi:MoaA/NifB/PqqE/SkfB family radical SAM enzyme